MKSLREKYIKEIRPLMKEKFGLKNDLAVPRLEKVVVNVGISATHHEEKFLEIVGKNLTRITGQKPVFTLAKKAISSFKTKEGQVVGAKVTLRGKKMYDFVDKLINVTLPRARDFRGLKTSAIDSLGNLNIGFKEHVAFAEIDASEVEVIHGLEVAITTSANNREKGLELFKLLGFPFQR